MARESSVDIVLEKKTKSLSFINMTLEAIQVQFRLGNSYLLSFR